MPHEPYGTPRITLLIVVLVPLLVSLIRGCRFWREREALRIVMFLPVVFLLIMVAADLFGYQG